MDLQGINRRVQQIIEDEGLNPNSFAERIGVAAPVIYNIVGQRLNKPSFDVLNKIIVAFDKIDANWLISGEGNKRLENKDIKLSTNTDQQSKTFESVARPANWDLDDVFKYSLQDCVNKVMLIDTTVKAGSLLGIYELPKENVYVFTLPHLEKGNYYGFVVEGDSMYSTLMHGDIVIANSKPLESADNIRNNEVYVLYHEDGLLIKRLTVDKNNKVIKLISDNSFYSTVELHYKEVKAIYSTKTVITNNLSPRNLNEIKMIEMYQKIIQEIKS
jgi:phage repressor protein C with HTH and peptisase S24 domain